MVGDRVVDPGADARARSASAAPPVAVLGNSDRVLVVDVRDAVGDTGTVTTPSSSAVEVGGVRAAACLVQAASLVELDATDGRVDVGHPGIEADQLVLVAALHALVAQQTYPARDLVDR